MRVFVSSVIDGYEDYRKAAKEAIRLLGDTPVMAEYDFGAKPMTPREACLEGVRGSDVYAGLFGSRYGYVTDRGISATEEEFEEAQRRGLPAVLGELWNCHVLSGITTGASGRPTRRNMHT